MTLKRKHLTDRRNNQIIWLIIPLSRPRVKAVITSLSCILLVSRPLSVSINNLNDTNTAAAPKNKHQWLKNTNSWSPNKCLAGDTCHTDTEMLDIRYVNTLHMQRIKRTKHCVKEKELKRVSRPVFLVLLCYAAKMATIDAREVSNAPHSTFRPSWVCTVDSIVT